MGEYDPWATEGLPWLNVAEICYATRALGPGVRAVVWVQGCCFRCPGCIAPEWIPRRMGRLVAPEDLAVELLHHPEVEGLTFSGGEPMLQASGLAALARAARRRRGLSVVCYTGFTLEELRERPPRPGVADLLAEVDVLIDGLYVSALDDGRGLRGSVNQRVHHLTDRARHYDFETGPRRVELQVRNGDVLMVGVPARQSLKALQAFARRMKGFRAGGIPNMERVG